MYNSTIRHIGFENKRILSQIYDPKLKQDIIPIDIETLNEIYLNLNIPVSSLNNTYIFKFYKNRQIFDITHLIVKTEGIQTHEAMIFKPNTLKINFDSDPIFRTKNFQIQLVHSLTSQCPDDILIDCIDSLFIPISVETTKI